MEGGATKERVTSNKECLQNLGEICAALNNNIFHSGFFTDTTENEAKRNLQTGSFSRASLM